MRLENTSSIACFFRLSVLPPPRFVFESVDRVLTNSDENFLTEGNLKAVLFTMFFIQQSEYGYQRELGMVKQSLLSGSSDDV
jgi:hypothetical protein